MTLPADIMVRADWPLELKKINVLIGGSGGLLVEHRDALLDNIFKCNRVFDADAIPHKSDFAYLDDQCVLTPHAGEFSMVFPDLKGAPESRAAKAAKSSGAIVVLKGPKTVIADPRGHVVVNDHASPYLAKAGSGDVLAGMIGGLIAQHMPIFEACCAAVWMHGEAGLRFGPGLIASDISDVLPPVLRDVLGEPSRGKQ